MPRDLSGPVAAEIAGTVKRPRIIAEIETASGFVRVWSGIGDLVWDGKTFVGVGTLGGVSAPEETTDLKATGIVFTMSGIPSALLEQSIAAVRMNLPARLWLAFVDVDGALVLDPVLLFEGTAGVPTTDDNGETCTISISAENLLASLRRPRVLRLTPEDQATRDSTDKGFDYVASLQDQKMNWGRS